MQLYINICSPVLFYHSANWWPNIASILFRRLWWMDRMHVESQTLEPLSSSAALPFPSSEPPLFPRVFVAPILSPFSFAPQSTQPSLQCLQLIGINRGFFRLCRTMTARIVSWIQPVHLFLLRSLRLTLTLLNARFQVDHLSCLPKTR